MCLLYLQSFGCLTVLLHVDVLFVFFMYSTLIDDAVMQKDHHVALCLMQTSNFAVIQLVFNVQWRIIDKGKIM